MPTCVVMGFVRKSAFSSVLKEDPYYFLHIGVTYLILKVASRHHRNHEKKFFFILTKNLTKNHKCIIDNLK